MNLDGLTNDQRTGVLHLEGPLLISAGAGSGKTFTLTQRIAHALLQGSVVDDIDGILAITFTEKAAGEIKARVRSTLHREGLSEQAHKVDAAWISTIHGMCARILRTHALELGIDPGFGVIEDTVRKEMIAQAINEVLEKSREDIALQSLVGGGISRTGALRGDAMRVRYAALFNEFVPRSVFPTQSSVVSMLETLLDKAANLGGGYDDFVFGPAPTKLEILARDLVRAYHEVLPFLEQAQNSKSAIDARVDAIRVVEVLEGLLKDWKKADAQMLARGVDASTGTFAPAEEDASERLSVFADTLEGCLLIGRNFGSAEVKEAVGEWKQVYLRIVHEVVCALARPALDDLMALVREVEECYVDAKRKAFVFDNDDLLIETLRAFEAHPPLVDHYQEQFKLVMVDEFQDTSQIQIDIIEKLAGQNSGKLCTVGDSQQSIYRFRGADVNVYEEHKNKMRAPAIGARYVELRKNFRSHGDILRFVDRVFEQPQVFGERFMSLEPHEERASSYHATTPRVDVLLTTRPGASGSGITVDDARRKEAQAIASRFAAFRAAGHDAKDMVVLLGKLTRAEVFAQAIRDEGFECVIAGGSLFDKAAEVQVVARFVEVLANPANTRALFEVLAGDMFRLCADDFLQLTTTYDSARGGLVRRSLERGLYQVTLLSKETSKPPSPHDTQALPARLRNAARILDRAKNSLGSESVAHIVEEALVDSGWITRLEGAGAQGMAQAANILKAVRHLKELEHKRKLGISRLAQEFRSELDLGLKEAPGALSGADTGVVKIMSIHASKGLEFPLVALADFSGIPPFRNALLVETCDGSAYVSLGLKETFNRYPTLQKRLAGFEPFEEGEPAHVYAHFLKTATDQAKFRAALKSFAHAEELEEVRRKFYVGLTRASEALVIAASVRLSAKEPEL
ncbi:MAG: UvrD-helicase domain-containing protein, partial [Coriobacteriaceae bacterium]|nr:UvrD-helicase domain-containing protein [Coriobacteriaceae bacterium]